MKSRDIERIHVKAIRSNNLLTGILKCGICGSGMTLSSGKSGKYKYYACTTKLKHSVDLCKSKWVPKEQLESLVLDAVLEKVITEDHLKQIIEDVKGQLNEKHSVHQAALLSLSRKQKSIDHKLESSYEQLAVRQDLMDASYADYLSNLQK